MWLVNRVDLMKCVADFSGEQTRSENNLDKYTEKDILRTVDNRRIVEDVVDVYVYLRINHENSESVRTRETV